MKNTILAGLLLASGLGCHSTTMIGSTDASHCNVTFPQSGFYGPNILYQGNDSFVSSPGFPYRLYELVVQHDAMSPITVTLTLLEGPVWQVPGNALDWHYKFSDGGGFFGVGGSESFEAPNVTGEFEEAIYFQNSGRAKLDVYECGATTPTFSKTISWSLPDGEVPPPSYDGGVVRGDASPQPPSDGPIIIYDAGSFDGPQGPRDGGSNGSDGGSPGCIGDNDIRSILLTRSDGLGCAVSGCHASGPLSAGISGGLDLTPDSNIGARLIGTNAGTSANGSACVGKGSYLNARSNPPTGLLMDKISNNPSCGDRMPWPGGAVVPALTSAQVACVSAWAEGLILAAP
jgi:hypothetical protein